MSNVDNDIIHYDLHPSEPYTSIDEVYPTNFVYFMSKGMTITSLFSQTLSPVLLYVIIKHSPKTMGNMKYLLVLYIISAMHSEICFVLLKPMVLFPLRIIYPVGYLSPVSDKITNILIINIFFGAFIICDLLIALLLQRWLTTSDIFVSRNDSYAKVSLAMLLRNALRVRGLDISRLMLFFQGCYLALIISHIILVLPTGIMLNIFKPSKEVTYNLAFHHIDGFDELLSRQPDLLSFNYKSDIFIMISLLNIILFGISRTICIIILTTLNILLLRDLKSKLSAQTLSQFRMYLRSILLQLLIVFIFIFIPAVILISCLLFSNHMRKGFSSRLYTFVLFSVHSYVLFDMIITIITIKPYMIWFTKLFDIVTLRRTGQITTSSNYNISFQ